MVAKFWPLAYEDQHRRQADGKFTREQHWRYACDPGKQEAVEPAGRYGDALLQPHSLVLTLRQWDGYTDEVPSRGNIWTAELWAKPVSGGQPMIVTPTFLNSILYVIDDWTPEGWPEVDVRGVIDVELLNYR